MSYTTYTYNTIKKFGDIPIVRAEARRTPIPNMINKLVNFLEANSWQNVQYDTYFHLFTIFYLETGMTIRCEKNETINVMAGKGIEGDLYAVDLKGKRPTLNQLLDATQQRMKGDFFPYDALKNNCQDFQMNLLAPFMNSGLKSFIKQSTEQLAKKMPSFVETLTKAGTDLASKITATKEGVNEWSNNHLGFDLIPFKRGGLAKKPKKRKTKVYFH